MASLKDIKRRIKSVKNTQQITKAMKMVSAAKLKKAQDEIVAARPYAEKLLGLISSLASKTSPESHPLLASTGGAKTGVVLITSDRGLCGSFNTVLLRTIERFLNERNESDISLYLIGKRSMEHFKRRQINVASSRAFGSGRPSYSQASEIARTLTDAFLKNELDEVYIIYSQFQSALTQTPVVQKLLPISTPKAEEGKAEEKKDEIQVEFLFEPSGDEVLSSLLPKYVEVQAFRALLESSASEHGARMTSMDSASKNAAEMINGLTLKYNRIRQAVITKELMEIIGGAEALKG
ncbi:MAG: ATP synthase F1 subunit gamma [Deltaproteobacteria bacterium]|nr:ATP synthase F1 subunit gamma [Deltaproteobacteria bacterium]